MIPRKMRLILQERLQESPVVALLGSRQVGKTTLARELVTDRPIHYLDLERPADLAKLEDPELYLQGFSDKLVILDEVQRLPELFPILRGMIDRRRAGGDRVGHFLVLGSASPALLRQASESLAGRISYLELGGLNLREVGSEQLHRHWIRGGYPDSFCARSDAAAMLWCGDLVTSYVERDLPQQGIRANPVELRRFLTMLAHQHGSLVNYSQLGKSMGWDQKTVSAYANLLESLYLLRRVSPWSGNLKKRLVKSPKLYLRDTGLLHSLLGIGDTEMLLGHPICGHSWEGYCIEQILNLPEQKWQVSHYRTHAGSEVDLVLEDGQNRIAVEIKRTLAPKISSGLREAIASLQATESHIIIPHLEGDPYPLAKAITVQSLPQFLKNLPERNTANPSGPAFH
jgi:hypothetical protein